MKRYQTRLIVAAVAIPVLVGLTLYNKNRSSDQLKSETYALLQELPSYKQEKEYIDSLFAASYDAAFATAYEQVGRHRPANFDAQKYITTIFGSMIARARSDSKESLARELEAIKTVVQFKVQQ